MEVRLVLDITDAEELRDHLRLQAVRDAEGRLCSKVTRADTIADDLHVAILKAYTGTEEGRG